VCLASAEDKTVVNLSDSDFKMKLGTLVHSQGSVTRSKTVIAVDTHKGIATEVARASRP
jgi:hypothetical protein